MWVQVLQHIGVPRQEEEPRLAHVIASRLRPVAPLYLPTRELASLEQALLEAKQPIVVLRLATTHLPRFALQALTWPSTPSCCYCRSAARYYCLSLKQALLLLVLLLVLVLLLLLVLVLLVSILMAWHYWPLALSVLSHARGR